jgi:hypothetical protein
MMTNVHVIKMILESAQLLSTAHRMLDGKMQIGLSPKGRKQTQWIHDKYDDVLYKATHVNHPSAVWCRLTVGNYRWLYDHFIALCNEYTNRYGKVHATESKLASILDIIPHNIPYGELTRFAQAMPEQYRSHAPVLGYRKYYAAEKIKKEVDLERYQSMLEET